MMGVVITIWAGWGWGCEWEGTHMSANAASETGSSPAASPPRAATRACGGGVARRREQERRMEGRHDGLGLVSNLHGEERPHPTDDRATRGATCHTAME